MDVNPEINVGFSSRGAAPNTPLTAENRNLSSNNSESSSSYKGVFLGMQLGRCWSCDIEKNGVFVERRYLGLEQSSIEMLLELEAGKAVMQDKKNTY